jgi:5-methylcytosine-specific restriction endonuclease McrA
MCSCQRATCIDALDADDDHPCSDCGERDPVVLEFDHVRDKRFSIGAEIARQPWQALLDEMAKCDVVCANCHRRRTARRGGFRRHRMSSGESGRPDLNRH